MRVAKIPAHSLVRKPKPNINFHEVKEVLRGHEIYIIQNLLPNGRREGREWVCLNRTRKDQNLGSFKINMQNFKWADFSTNDKGGDIISLYAYVKGMSQLTAAKELMRIIGRDYD